MRLSARAINKAESVAVFAVLLGSVVILQVLGGAYASGFGGYADEPAHLVSSLMVRDFFAGFDFRQPWQFAQQYYFHYPKVAIGVWPPGFYAALGMWFLIFGTSRASAIIFIGHLRLGYPLVLRWRGCRAGFYSPNLPALFSLNRFPSRMYLRTI